MEKATRPLILCQFSSFSSQAASRLEVMDGRCFRTKLSLANKLSSKSMVQFSTYRMIRLTLGYSQ